MLRRIFFFAPSVPVCATIISVKEYLKIYRLILMGQRSWKQQD